VTSGGVLSELHPNVRPSGPRLMARDRIVSGLSRAVIVVEAKENSGSLDTAARAKQQGRPVFAVAGTPGADQLIASGAQSISPELAGFGSVAETIASQLLSGETC
jgi:DNA processing protein